MIFKEAMMNVLGLNKIGNNSVRVILVQSSTLLVRKRE